MPKLVYEKMGIGESHHVLIIDGPAEAIEAIELPARVHTQPGSNNYDHIILFKVSRKDLEADFLKFKNLLNGAGKLWVAWPKSRKLGTDLNIKEVIRIGYNHGLVESTNLRINDTWTALKFTHPKQGKIYNNSYGTLPEQVI